MEKIEERFIILNKKIKIKVESEVLDLSNKNVEKISRIKGLQSLKNIRILRLANNNIKIIKNLGSLKNLEELDLSINEIEEIQGLEYLVKLKKLNLSQNSIQEIKGLDSLVNLEILNLSYNQILRIEGLSKLVNLRHIALFYNNITQIQNLDNLENLKMLYLDFNRISTIFGLENLLKLEILGLSQNRISTIENLQNLQNLTNLDLSKNQLSKIEGLEENTNLKILNLYMNNILEIQGLKKLENLEELMLFDNNIQQINNLSNLKKLKKLDLMNNSISEMEGIGDLENLEELDLVSNRLSEINSLKNLKKLKHLYLADNLITEIKNLENLDHLETINLNHNEISNMEGIESLKSLKRIDLSNNNINKVVNLNEFKVLQTLTLRNNKIESIDNFPRYLSQFTLDLRENNMEDVGEFLKFQNINLLHIDLRKMKYNNDANITSIQDFIDKMINQYLYFYDGFKDKTEEGYAEVNKEHLDDVLIGYNMRLLFTTDLSDINRIQQEFLVYIDQRIAIEKTSNRYIYIGLKELMLSIIKTNIIEKITCLLKAKENFNVSGNNKIIHKYMFTLKLISLVFSSLSKSKFDLANISYDLINSKFQIDDKMIKKFTINEEFINPIISQIISFTLEENRTYDLYQRSPENLKELLKDKPRKIRNMLENLKIEEINLVVEQNDSNLSTLKIYFAQMNLRKAYYDLSSGEFYPNEIPQIIEQIEDQLEKAKSVGANFIFFPEYSFPKQIINKLIRFSRENNIWIVGGGERFDDAKFQCTRNENVALIFPPNNSPIIQKKRFKGKTEPHLDRGKDIKIIHSEFGSFSVLICADFLEDYLLVLLREKVDFIIVPSFNRDVNLFRGNGMAQCSKNCCFIFINNVTQYSDSRIYAPYKGKNKEVTMQSFPYYEINLSEFKKHRMGFLSKNFKPPLSRTLYS